MQQLFSKEIKADPNLKITSENKMNLDTIML